MSIKRGQSNLPNNKLGGLMSWYLLHYIGEWSRVRSRDDQEEGTRRATHVVSRDREAKEEIRRKGSFKDANGWEDTEIKIGLLAIFERKGTSGECDADTTQQRTQIDGDQGSKEEEGLSGHAACT